MIKQLRLLLAQTMLGWVLDIIPDNTVEKKLFAKLLNAYLYASSITCLEELENGKKENDIR